MFLDSTYSAQLTAHLTSFAQSVVRLYNSSTSRTVTATETAEDPGDVALNAVRQYAPEIVLLSQVIYHLKTFFKPTFSTIGMDANNIGYRTTTTSIPRVGVRVRSVMLFCLRFILPYVAHKIVRSSSSSMFMSMSMTGNSDVSLSNRRRLSTLPGESFIGGERLRGRERRAFAAGIRDRMVGGGGGGGGNSSNGNQDGGGASLSSVPHRPPTTEIPTENPPGRLRILASNFLSSLVSSAVPADDETNADFATNLFQTPPQTSVKWVTTIHLAVYFLQGTYPSLYHRLLGLSPVSTVVETKTKTKKRAEEDKGRLLGQAIFCFVGIAAGKVFGKALVEMGVRGRGWYEERLRQSRGVRFSPTPLPRRRCDGNGDNKIKCPLCLTVGCTVPTAVVGCGHVFCWDCVGRVLKNVDEGRDGSLNCPVCRLEIEGGRGGLIILENV